MAKIEQIRPESFSYDPRHSLTSPPPSATTSPKTTTSTKATTMPQPTPILQDQQHNTPIMLRLSPLCSTPIFVNYMTVTYEELLRQIEYEAYSRAPEITQGFIFDGLYVEWEQQQQADGAGVAYPCSSKLDKGNFMATIALLGARRGRDVLCVKARVASPGMRLQLA